MSLKGAQGLFGGESEEPACGTVSSGSQAGGSHSAPCGSQNSEMDIFSSQVGVISGIVF